MTERYGWDQTPTPDLGLDITKAPADIQKLYKWIIEKMYGEDVASAYGQAMVLTGILSKNAEAMSLFTSGKMDTLETFVRDTLIELTNKDIISAPEIIMARNGEPTLAERLDRDFGGVEKIVGINVSSPPFPLNPAVGDGVSDDGIRLRDIHEFANEHNLKVTYPPDKIYYVSNVSEIEVRTDWDLNGSTIVINDQYEPLKHVFKIVEDTQSIDLDQGVFDEIIPLMKTTVRRVPQLAGYGNAFVTVVNSNKRIYNKIGYWADSGTPQTDIFFINNLGDVLTPIDLDFDDLTSINIQPISNRPLHIENLSFRSTGDYFGTSTTRHRRGVLINRSNVLISNFEHSVDNYTSESNPSTGILEILRCGNVELRKAVLSPKLAPLLSPGVRIGTYDFTANYVCNLMLDSVNAYDSNKYGVSDHEVVWGFMQGDRLKNFYIKNSMINRVDSHSGINNLTIENTTLGNVGLTLVGFGDLILKNVTSYSDTLIALRSDMGSFWNGDVYIDGVNQYVPEDAKFNLFYIMAEIQHDFGYPTMMGNNLISVKNYTVHLPDNYSGDLILIEAFVSKSGSESRKDYTLAREFIFENCRVVGGGTDSGFTLFVGSSYYDLRAKTNFVYEELQKDSDGMIHLDIKHNIRVSCKNVQFKNLGYITYNSEEANSNLFDTNPFGARYPENYTSIANRLLPEIILEDCNVVYPTTKALPFILMIRNCQVRAMYNHWNGGSRSKAVIENSVIDPRTSDGSNLFRVNRPTYKFVNCDIMAPKNPDGTLITGVGVKTVYQFLTFGLTGNYIEQLAGFIDCTLDVRIDLNSLKVNYADYAYLFGNHSAYSIFPRRRGTTSQRPEKVYPGLSYYDTTLGKLVTWNGTAWV